MKAKNAGYTLQLFVQVLLMFIALGIAGAVFFYTYGMDRWRGPWAEEAYYRLGDYRESIERPDFARVTPTPLIQINESLMGAGTTGQAAPEQAVSGQEPAAATKPAATMAE